MITEKNKDEFYQIADSLKKFKRADVKDNHDRSLINELYTDLLPDNHVYKMSYSDNTTFLIGRKGTGKSTIILKLENEYRNKADYISCYIDTKTVFESTKSEYTHLDYLKGKIPADILNKYLIERTFIQSILKEIISELDKKSNSYLAKLASKLGVGKVSTIKDDIRKLVDRISDNKHLQSIELPVIDEYIMTVSGAEEVEHSKNMSLGMEVKVNEQSAKLGGGLSGSKNNKIKEIEGWERQFSGTLLKVFQIKDIINEIKNILSKLKIKKLVIFLDDFSEVDEKTLKNFVNVILAPLNNWGDEFICFKVAAYPNRIFYGDIDKGKIDVIDLDFYNLYSNYDKNTMESLSLDFTKRLLNTRLKYYSTNKIDDFFDVTSSYSLDNYMEQIFKATMNVPRIIGYILFYCHQTHISLGKKINKSAIDSAAQKYYERIIHSFFDITTNSLMSFDEKISELQNKELLSIFTSKLKEIRKQIITGNLKAVIYEQDKTNPYTSHFYFSPRLEGFIKTLELNFFVSKYSEMSDRDGNKVSIYCLNYGLTLLENLRWGKPNGNDYRKYFIARPFNFNGAFEEFLRKSKSIVCVNHKCKKVYPYEDLPYIEFNKMRCVECQSEVKVIAIATSIEEELKKIEKSKLLPPIELGILHELNASQKKLYARELSEELDISSYLVAKRAEKLDKDKGLVNREKKSGQLIKYSITDKAIKSYFSDAD